jgi:parallel beta-helix repeat protein
MNRHFRILFGFLLFPPTLLRGAVLIVSQQNSSASDENLGTEQKPLKTISAAAAKTHAGDKVVIHRGDYRETVIIKNSGTKEAPIIFEAAPGEAVVIKGSDLIEKWTRMTSNVWKAKMRPPAEHSSRGDDPAFWNTNDVRQVFIKDGLLLDAIRLRPSATKEKLQAGSFFNDRSNSMLYVWLGDSDDPNKYKMEAATRGAWLNILGSHVLVRGLQMRHASTLAISNWPACNIYGEGSRLENCTITWGDFVGVSLYGKGNSLVGCLVACHGNSGMGGTGESHLIENCRFVYNNLDRYSADWHCGGAKLTGKFNRGRITGNEFAGNAGPGLWLDGSCDDNRIERNFCHDNEGSGIMVEISSGNLVVNNICVGNRNSLAAEELKPAPDAAGGSNAFIRQNVNERKQSSLIYQGGGGLGIFISSAPKSSVINNTCYLNEGGGITVEGPLRGDAATPMSTHDCRVLNNISVFNKGPQLIVRKNGVDADTSGNSSDYNLLLAVGGILAKNGWAGETAFSVPDWRRISGQDSHSVEGDPHFAMPVMGDFRLLEGSPALGVGVNLDKIENDFFGRPRPKGHVSIGAAEQSAPDSPKTPLR